MPSKRTKRVTWSPAHGTRLKERRTALGLSLKAVAEAARCTASRVLEIERGEVHGRPTAPSPGLLKRITAFYERQERKRAP